MSDPAAQKKFEARVPQRLWDQYETWAQGRVIINNTQLLTGLLRLFLRAPEWLQFRVLLGREDEVPTFEEVVAREIADAAQARAGKPPEKQGAGRTKAG